ncbi:WD repeat-containing protein 54-like [Styela clava]
MYETVTPIPLKTSTSSLFNNLDILPTNGEEESSSLRNASYLSIHKYEVGIVQRNNASFAHRQVIAKESSSQHNTFLIDAKWCQLKNQTILVIAHVRGFQMFDELGNLLLFWHSTLERGVLSEGKTAFCRGISSLGDTVFVGTCKGEILVVETMEMNTFNVSQTLSAHPSSVTTITTLKDAPPHAKVNVATADDEGSISVWKMREEGKLKFVGSITGSRYPCTALCLLNDGLLAASYYTGHIRIFDAPTQEMLAEITAHVAPISSMDCYNARGHSILLSASEDTYLRVWKISKTDKLKISQEWYTYVEDLLICGVKFHPGTDEMFAVTGYDSNEITLFKKT